jgi:hypothetical protein
VAAACRQEGRRQPLEAELNRHQQRRVVLDRGAGARPTRSSRTAVLAAVLAHRPGKRAVPVLHRAGRKRVIHPRFDHTALPEAGPRRLNSDTNLHKRFSPKSASNGATNGRKPAPAARIRPLGARGSGRRQPVETGRNITRRLAYLSPTESTGHRSGLWGS